MQPAPTVFVVDADPLARRMVRHAAQMINLPCQQYASGREFLDRFDPSSPGCAVLEIRIPDISGFELQRLLAHRAPALPVVFVAGQASVSAAVRAMRAGALHFLEKPLREHELWDVLQEATHVNQWRRQVHQQRRQFTERIDTLSDQEHQMVEMIVAGQSNRQMASELGVCLRTVELRRARLMKKLNVKSLTELIRLALVAKDGFLLQ